MKAMEEALITVPENWIVQGDFEPESGYRAMQQIVSQPHRPTAVFCGGDIMAMGALCARQMNSACASPGYLGDRL